MKKVGILYDNISGNTGDVAIGISVRKILREIGVDFEQLFPGNFNPNDYQTIIIGGGHLIRSSPDFFYDKFKVRGNHILNSVGILGRPTDLHYLNDYKYVTVRTRGDYEALNDLDIDVDIVPCTTMILDDLEEISINPESPSLGIHLTPNMLTQEEQTQFIKWASALPFKIYFVPITHYNQDYLYMGKISSKIPNSILLPILNPLEILTFLGRLDYFISSSLHGAIFSYVHNVPFIIFNYNAKMLDFMKDRGLQEYTFVNLKGMIETFDLLLHVHPNYSESIFKDKIALENHIKRIENLLPSGIISASAFDETRTQLNSQMLQLQSQAMAHEQEIFQLRKSLIDRDSQILSLSDEMKDRDNQILSLSDEMKDRDNQILSLSDEIRKSNEHMRTLEHEIAEMQSSMTWKMTMRFHDNFVERALSQGTKRRRLYDLGLKGGRILVNDGYRSFWEAFMRYLRNEKNLRIGSREVSSIEFKKMEEFFALHEDVSELNDSFSYRPKISIIMPTWNTEERWLRRAIDSVRIQSYDNWELCIADGGSTASNLKDILRDYSNQDPRIKVKFLSENLNISENSNQALTLASGEFVGFLDHDDELTPNALHENAKLLNMHIEADLIYSDHAKIDENGMIYDKEFKPDWSPELLLSYCYIGHLKVIRKKVLDDVGGFRSKYDGSQDYDLLLRVTEKTERVYHIPEILYLWRATKKSIAQSACCKPYSIESGRMAVEDAIKRRVCRGEVIIPDFASSNRLGIYKIKFQVTDQENVTIIIPTKNNVEFLKRCIGSIENKTTYKNYYILILDNGSDRTETLEFLKSINDKHRVIRVITDGFNFSRLVNFGVSQATSDIVILLNDDTEIITPSWIEDMLGWIDYDKRIGAVGCKLIFSDERIQHAGVVLGLCGRLADHAFKLSYYKDGGYLNYSNVVRNYSAVTAACIMTRKSLFEGMGGFDEDNLPVSFNDVDFCLKLVKNQFRIVYTPDAILYHHEGKSRGVGERIDNQQEIDYFERKWENLILYDAFYNKNLSLSDHSFKFKSDDKILLISHNLNTEGAPILLFNIGKSLKKRGYQVAVVSPNDGHLRSDYSKQRINSYIIGPRDMADFLEYYKPKIALVNTIVSFEYIEILKKCGIKIVWIIHESEREIYFKNLIGLSSSQFDMADQIVFVSDATRAMYEDLCKKDNFLTIYNGLDLSEIEEVIENNDKSLLRSQLGYPQDALIIITVGTVCPRKNQEAFARAAVDLLNREEYRNKDIYFLIAGANGDEISPEGSYLNKIKMYISNNKNIQIIYRQEIPERSDIFKYYLISDIFVCTSVIEAFPMTILEAMSFRLPVVSTDVFGIKEQIINNNTGLFFDLKDPDDLNKKIIALMDKKTRVTFGENSYQRLKEKFTIEKMTSNYERLILSLIRE